MTLPHSHLHRPRGTGIEISLVHISGRRFSWLNEMVMLKHTTNSQRPIHCYLCDGHLSCGTDGYGSSCLYTQFSRFALRLCTYSNGLSIKVGPMYRIFSSDFSDFAQDRSNISHITQMSYSIKFSKMFSDQMPQNLDNITPFFLRAKRSPTDLDVSLLTVVNEDSVDDLVDLAEMWQGPVCAVLHIESTSALPPDTTTFLFRVRHMHESNPSMRAHVDIHLIITPPRESDKLSLSMNQNRNLARLFARSEFVIHVDPNILHISDITFTLAAKREQYHELLLSGDVLVIPSFVHISAAEEGIPQDKHTVVAMLDAQELAMYDLNRNVNEGPTNLNQWKESKTLYAAKYDNKYAPIVIMSRSQQPWCPERFTDNLASCFLGTHLAGGTFWVLADDYVIRAPNTKAHTLNKAEIKMEEILYNRYVPEMCVHYARKLASLGLWSSSSASNIKSWSGCHSTRSTWRSLTVLFDK